MPLYICSCGQEVVANDTPGPIKWSDGHVCRFGAPEPEDK